MSYWYSGRRLNTNKTFVRAEGTNRAGVAHNTHQPTTQARELPTESASLPSSGRERTVTPFGAAWKG